ncbi:MAG: hypothetical protein ACFFA6_09865, partial [Promethearchaeota archaeon]
MRKYSKIGIICLLSLFTLSALSPMVVSTTIGDTTFPADVGKRYEWRLTYPSAASGFKLGFTADSITQGVHMTHESLIVYATISMYYPSPYNEWIGMINNSLYLAANETENYLYFDYGNLYMPFIIPTPINLLLVATTITAFPNMASYSIDGNTITFNLTDGYTTYEFTYNSNGFITVGIYKEYGDMEMKFELGGGGDDEIPFGIYFIVPTVISIAVIIIFVKKRQL